MIRVIVVQGRNINTVMASYLNLIKQSYIFRIAKKILYICILLPLKKLCSVISAILELLQNCLTVLCNKLLPYALTSIAAFALSPFIVILMPEALLILFDIQKTAYIVNVLRTLTMFARNLISILPELTMLHSISGLINLYNNFSFRKLFIHTALLLISIYMRTLFFFKIQDKIISNFENIADIYTLIFYNINTFVLNNKLFAIALEPDNATLDSEIGDAQISSSPVYLTEEEDKKHDRRQDPPTYSSESIAPSPA